MSLVYNSQIEGRLSGSSLYNVSSIRQIFSSVIFIHVTLASASVQLSSVTQLCLTLCNPMDCSTPGLPVHHQLPESTKTHVHCVGDAIQPSHPLSSPSPPALNLSQHQVFSNESALRVRWPKYWSFSFNISPSNEHPGLISFRMDWLDLCSPWDSKESSLIPQFKSINSLVLSFLYGPTHIHT